MKLSIIFGTYNRKEMLQACVDSVRRGLGYGTFDDYEFVIVDAGSNDGSREWMAGEADIVLLGEWKLEGAVKAFNKAYAISSGEYVALLNDDVELMNAKEGRLMQAVERLEADEKAGQLAFGFTRGSPTNPAAVLNSHANKPYANLGMIKRSIADKVISITGGLWSPVYHTYGADTELSCWVHRLGYSVIKAPDIVFHDKLCFDELRKINYRPEHAEKDGKTFWARWPDPAMLTPKGPRPNLTSDEQYRLTLLEGDA